RAGSHRLRKVARGTRSRDRLHTRSQWHRARRCLQRRRDETADGAIRHSANGHHAYPTPAEPARSGAEFQLAGWPAITEIASDPEARTLARVLRGVFLFRSTAPEKRDVIVSFATVRSSPTRA